MAASDLQTLKSDASQGAGTGPGDCSNMSTISSDASSTLASDLTSTIASDVSTLQGDISTVNKDISTVQSDIQTLQSDGVLIPADVSGAIGSAQSAIASIKQGGPDLHPASLGHLQRPERHADRAIPARALGGG